MGKTTKSTKKTVRQNVVIPNPKDVKTGIPFEELEQGNYFIMDGRLWHRLEEGYLDQAAVDAITGEVLDDLCDEKGLKVIPVIATVTWEIK